MNKLLVYFFLCFFVVNSAAGIKPGELAQATLSCQQNDFSIDVDCTVDCFVVYNNGSEDSNIDTCAELPQGRWILNVTIPQGITDGPVQLCFNGSNVNGTDFSKCAFIDVQRGTGWTIAALLGAIIPAILLFAIALNINGDALKGIKLLFVGGSVLFVLISVRVAGAVAEVFTGLNSVTTQMMTTAWRLSLWLGIIGYLIFALFVYWENIKILLSLSKVDIGGRKL